jgi:hypothetical protein
MPLETFSSKRQLKQPVPQWGALTSFQMGYKALMDGTELGDARMGLVVSWVVVVR